MKQYLDIKQKYPDCVVFFRLGDFYEMFCEDAIEISRLLNLTLTKRQETPMCGIPYHAASGYLSRLTRAGKKIAICEQLSDPNLPGIVKRDVVRVVTPGTTFDERVLNNKQHHFIVSIIPEKMSYGIAAADVTTGLFQVMYAEGVDGLSEALMRLEPAELIVEAHEQLLPEVAQHFASLPVFPHQQWHEPAQFLAEFYKVKNIEAFGFGEHGAVVKAAALLLSYLKETQKSDLTHMQPPRLLSATDELILDENAVRNLELLSTLRERTVEGSLLSVIDMTLTAMGARMLRSWLLHPLHSILKINERLDAIEEVIGSFELKSGLEEALKKVLDIERLLGRITVTSGNARDMLGIAHSLSAREQLQKILATTKTPLFIELQKQCEATVELEKLRQHLMNALVDEPPLSVKDGGLIRDGYNAELDELRALEQGSKAVIQRMQEEEIARTGINSLKIRYNQIFGYYIEITKTHLAKVPENYTRKQTMTNAERYITPELKILEEKILGAETKARELEHQLFLKLREEVTSHTRLLQDAARLFATVDVLRSFARLAELKRYVRPLMKEAGAPLMIKDGRHPVVEAVHSEQFVPNDTSLAESELMLITGPNMGGKSTYLRQTALVVLMAHMGSFVPASVAEIPLIDRIFTRVGASDNLVRGQSTFMVEMQETAHILHYATRDSLIILDEIGRGTSTYDGVSLAWSILEHIHNVVQAKTIFATHYHELIAVADQLPRAVNFSAAVQENKDGIIFLYRIISGAIDRSYGIEVARLAGLPKEIISHAKEILSNLEEDVVNAAVKKEAHAHVENDSQPSLFVEREHKVLKELSETDVDNLTPLQALQKLHEMKNL